MCKKRNQGRLLGIALLHAGIRLGLVYVRDSIHDHASGGSLLRTILGRSTHGASVPLRACMRLLDCVHACDYVRWLEGARPLHSESISQPCVTGETQRRDGRFYCWLQKRPAEEEHLALMGPIIRAEVGDRVVVHLQNKLPFTVNFEPQGLLASKEIYKVVAGPSTTAVYTFEVPEQVPSHVRCLLHTLLSSPPPYSIASIRSAVSSFFSQVVQALHQ